MTTPAPNSAFGPAPGPSAQREFPCKQCGAKLLYAPGVGALKCDYCGFQNQIAVNEAPIEEQDFDSALAKLESAQPTDDLIIVRCTSCAAETPLKPNVTSQSCPFCGSPIVATGESRKLLRPQALLPFAITSEQARDRFRLWLASLWFAPSNLKTYASVEAAGGSGGKLAGFYMPHWTFDAHAFTPYHGQRGDDYWETQTYSVTVNGRSETRTRQVRRTRWRSVSGSVDNDFDDVLVAASRSLPQATFEAIENWDLPALVPYADEFLSGFQSESYTIDLREGFTLAKAEMEEGIRSTIRADIGGDHQQIDSMSPRYSEITFKHILLPVWIAAYRYDGKTYRFVINARTGAVTGDRPYSWRKITLLVVSIVVAIAIIALIAIASNK